MEIVVNGVAHEVADALPLDRAVALVTEAASGVAAALNGEVVRRVRWPATRLAAGDRVEVVTAVQGG